MIRVFAIFCFLANSKNTGKVKNKSPSSDKYIFTPLLSYLSSPPLSVTKTDGMNSFQISWNCISNWYVPYINSLSSSFYPKMYNKFRSTYDVTWQRRRSAINEINKLMVKPTRKSQTLLGRWSIQRGIGPTAFRTSKTTHADERRLAAAVTHWDDCSALEELSDTA